MTPERQKILAGEISDLSDKIDNDADNNYNVDLEDYMNLQKMAAILARQVEKDTTAEKLEKAQSLLTGLVGWAKTLGGWEAPVWHETEQFLRSRCGLDVK